MKKEILGLCRIKPEYRDKDDNGMLYVILSKPNTNNRVDITPLFSSLSIPSVESAEAKMLDVIQIDISKYLRPKQNEQLAQADKSALAEFLAEYLESKNSIEFDKLSTNMILDGITAFESERNASVNIIMF